MKILKIMALSLSLLCVNVYSTFAQTKGADLSEEQKEEIANQVEAYFSELNLSDDQKTQFEAITTKYAEQMKAVREEGGSKLKKYNKIKAIRKDKDNEVKELLTAEQYKVYQERQNEMRQKMKEKRKNSN